MMWKWRARSNFRWDDVDWLILETLVKARFTGKAIAAVLRRTPRAVYAARRKRHGLRSMMWYRNDLNSAWAQVKTTAGGLYESRVG